MDCTRLPLDRPRGLLSSWFHRLGRGRKAGVFDWIRQSVARQTATVVGSSLALAAVAVWQLSDTGVLPSMAGRLFTWIALAVVLVSTCIAWLLTSRLLGARLAHLVD